MKLMLRVFSWHPWIPGALKLDSILSLFKCELTYSKLSTSPIRIISLKFLLNEIDKHKLGL